MLLSLNNHCDETDINNHFPELQSHYGITFIFQLQLKTGLVSLTTSISKMTETVGPMPQQY